MVQPSFHHNGTHYFMWLSEVGTQDSMFSYWSNWFRSDGRVYPGSEGVPVPFDLWHSFLNSSN